MGKGKLVVIEGIDGCGKSTLVRNICEKHPNFVSFAVPQKDTELGKLIRKCNAEGNANSNELALMNTIDKLDLVPKIHEELNQGKNVVLDRWYLSQFIYNKPTIERLETILLDKIIESLSIDLQIYLDISVDLAIERINKRGEAKDIFEEREYLQRNIDGYRSYIGTVDIEKQKIVVIDADIEPEMVLSVASHVMYEEGFEL